MRTEHYFIEEYYVPHPDCYCAKCKKYFGPEDSKQKEAGDMKNQVNEEQNPSGEGTESPITALERAYEAGMLYAAEIASRGRCRCGTNKHMGLHYSNCAQGIAIEIRHVAKSKRARAGSGDSAG